MARYHLNCASGIAGDMFLGACLDLGMPLAVVADAVACLGLRGVTVEQRKASRGGIVGTRFRVLVDGVPIEGPDPDEAPAPHGHTHDHSSAHAADHGHTHDHPHAHAAGHAHAHGRDPGHSHVEALEHDHQPGPHSHHHGAAHEHSHGPEGGSGHEHAGVPVHSHTHSHGVADAHDPHGQRDLEQIQTLIGTSSLPLAVRERALRLFARLGEAEAKAHGVPIERVHFHEVGAVDSIVDLVGAAAAIEYLAPEGLTCSAVNVGGGRVTTAHGELPVPAPATAELLHGVPVHGGPGGELTTPTGAVLLAELVDAYVELPPMVLEATGYGLGRKDLKTQPNAVRLLRGHAVPAAVVAAAATAEGLPAVAVVECEVDDLAGEAFGYLMERLLAAGALDVYFTPVVMKKSRPGTLVTLLCRPPQVQELAFMLLLESGSLGCRYHLAARFEAERDLIEVDTAFGRVRIKRGRLGGRALALAPEYEDCRRLALAAGVPWREIYRAALAAAPAA